MIRADGVNHVACWELASNCENDLASWQAFWKTRATYLATCFRDLWASFGVDGVVDTAAADHPVRPVFRDG